MIDRTLEKELMKLANWFPVVSVTGPRQSGKSTLVQAAFPDYDYVNLEEPELRQRALIDPTGFVASLDEHAIIDEAQYAPELFSAIQAQADRRGTPGQFVFSGSQNFLLLGSIRQSLAGRVGIAYLMPLTYEEIARTQGNSDPFELMARGSYPALHATSIPTDLFYDNYIDTYLTRDVVGYLDVRNESDFRRFLVACAARAGSLINYADLSRDVGVSVPTVKSWLSILESSFIVLRLMPYHVNVSKRLTKTPKLFFCDTGLLCHLLGIASKHELERSNHLDAIFENYVISERSKRWTNQLKRPELFFYRDDSKIEVDMMDRTDNGSVTLCEIKAGKTYRTSFSRNVKTIGQALGIKPSGWHVVYGGEGVFADDDVSVYGIREWLTGVDDR